MYSLQSHHIAIDSYVYVSLALSKFIVTQQQFITALNRVNAMPPALYVYIYTIILLYIYINIGIRLLFTVGMGVWALLNCILAPYTAAYLITSQGNTEALLYFVLVFICLLTN